MSISPWARPQKKMMRERCGDGAGEVLQPQQLQLVQLVQP